MADAPKLLDRVRAEVRLRHYSRRTEEAYVHWIRRYIVFHGKRHPRDLNALDVTAFLTNMDDFAAYNRVYAEHFPDNRPARTTVEVSRLPTPIAVELKVIATID